MLNRTPGIFESPARHDPAEPALGNLTSILTVPDPAFLGAMANPPTKKIGKKQRSCQRQGFGERVLFCAYGTVDGSEISYRVVGSGRRAMASISTRAPRGRAAT